MEHFDGDILQEDSRLRNPYFLSSFGLPFTENIQLAWCCSSFAEYTDTVLVGGRRHRGNGYCSSQLCHRLGMVLSNSLPPSYLLPQLWLSAQERLGIAQLSWSLSSLLIGCTGTYLLSSFEVLCRLCLWHTHKWSSWMSRYMLCMLTQVFFFLFFLYTRLYFFQG